MTLVQELENSIDIVELVSKYIHLKKAGTNYKAVCPFPGHSEKTASFVVSPVKQLAYCFWCHKWGGPLKFIMDLENSDFKEALQTLAQITGKKIEGMENVKFESHKDIYQLLKDITNFYEKSLKESPEMIEYFKKRGIIDSDIETFHLWFASDGRALFRYLKDKWYADELIDESKVFLDIKNQKDKFLWRIIFPIQNIRGDIVAFAGRIVGSGEPKYLNSPTTNIYDKSSILYGAVQWKKDITTQNFVIICEGYMDTIALQRAGFKNTVCVSGTALTEKHVQILKRLTSKFYLCFDNDKAWENATKLSLEILKNKGIEVHIINMSWGKDPDEIIKEWGDFDSLLKNSLSPIGFYLQKMDINIESLDEKRRALREILQILKDYSDNIEREFYLKEIWKKLEISERIVYDEFNKIRWEKNEEKKTTLPFIGSEERLMAFLVYDRKFSSLIRENLIFFDLCGEDLKKFIENTSFLDNLSLEKKELIRWLALKIEEESKSFTEEKILLEVKWICQKLNFDIWNQELKKYQKLVEENPENTEYQIKKIELARKLKSTQGKNPESSPKRK